jgi:hypothetical protein
MGAAQSRRNSRPTAGNPQRNQDTPRSTTGIPERTAKTSANRCHQSVKSRHPGPLSLVAPPLPSLPSVALPPANAVSGPRPRGKPSVNWSRRPASWRRAGTAHALDIQFDVPGRACVSWCVVRRKHEMPEPASTGALAATATVVGKKVFDSLAKKVADRIGSMTTAAQIAVAFRKGFPEYLETSYKRCRVFKTIIAPSDPLAVLSHYVHVTLTCGKKTVSDDDLITSLPELGCVVVTGLAGSGKSMFMRYLTLRSFSETSETIPLFVELRRLNSLPERNLLALLRNECTSKMSVIPVPPRMPDRGFVVI